MAKKRAYQTYYRDKYGELRVQLVDAETGKPVTNSKDYTVVDSTDVQGEEVTGVQPEEDGNTDATKVTPKKFFKRVTTEGGREKGKGGSRAKNDETNNFGFISKPGWTKYASLVPGPIGKIAMAGNTIVNGVNVNAINEARKHLGLEPMSMKDVVKGVVTGVDEGAVGDVSIGKKSYGVSLNEPVIDGKTQLTAKEARVRKDMSEMQAKVAEHLQKNGFPAARSKLHPELSPIGAEIASPKKGKGLADVVKGKPKGLPAGLEMVDGYRAKLGSVNFDDFDIDPLTKEKAKEFQSEAKKRGLEFAVDVKNMVRTPEEQAATVARGKSKTKMSEHMAGVGIDVSPIDDQDQVGWANKRSLANELGWSQLGESLTKSWDPGHMGLTQSNDIVPGGLKMTKEQAIAERDYFGSIPESQARREQLGLGTFTQTPTDRPTTAPASYSDPVKAMSPKEQFYSEQYAYAKEAGLTGIAADVAVSQAAIESGYGTGQLASKNNNFHSMKAGKTWTGPTADYMDDEPGPSSFRSYENPVESYKDWAKTMETNFPGVLTAKDLPEAIEGLKHGRLGMYATDFMNPDPAKNYATKLSKSYEEARSFAPAPDLGPKATSFTKYSAGFYSAIQKQPDAQTQANKAREDSANRPQIASMDNPMSPVSGMPGAPGANSTANFGGAKASAGAVAKGGNGSISPGNISGGLGSTRGSGSTGAGIGGSPAGGMGGKAGFGKSIGSGGSAAGVGIGKSVGGSTASAGKSSFGSGFSGPGGNASKSGSSSSNKDKDKSQGPSGGGYGGWGGPH